MQRLRTAPRFSRSGGLLLHDHLNGDRVTLQRLAVTSSDLSRSRNRRRGSKRKTPNDTMSAAECSFIPRLRTASRTAKQCRKVAVSLGFCNFLQLLDPLCRPASTRTTASPRQKPSGRRRMNRGDLSAGQAVGLTGLRKAGPRRSRCSPVSANQHPDRRDTAAAVEHLRRNRSRAERHLF